MSPPSSSPVDLRAQIEASIRQVIEELLEMPVTPHVRELRAKAVTYGRVIENWKTYPPTAPQLEAMHECVSELGDKVSEARARDVSGVSRKPSKAAGPTSSSVPPETWNAAMRQPTPWQGVRAVTSRRPAPATPSIGPSGPPPASGPTAPPQLDTPTPALLRSRRSR